MTSHLKYIALALFCLLGIATASAQTKAEGGAAVSDEELNHWLKEFGQEVIDTLENAESKNINSRDSGDEDLNYLIKVFGNDVLDTLNSISASSKGNDSLRIVDEKLNYLLKNFGNNLLDSLQSSQTAAASRADSIKIVDDKLNYLLKGFGNEVIKTLTAAGSDTKGADTVKVVDDRLNYLLKGFGQEVLKSLDGADAASRQDSIKMVDEKLNYLLKGFGKDVISNLSGKNETSNDSTQETEDKLNYLLKGFGQEVLDTLSGKAEEKQVKDSEDSVDDKLNYLLKDFGQEVLDTLSRNVKKPAAKANKTSRKSRKKDVSENISADEAKDMRSRVEGDVDAIMKKTEPVAIADPLRAETLLDEVDSLLIGMGVSKTNPLFLDWVMGVPGAVSISLNDEDSIVVDLRNHVKDYIRATAPELYKFHKDQLPDISDLKGSHLNNIKKEQMMLNLDSLMKDREEKIEALLPRISKWSMGAKFQAHASQNYITQNWYKGGESNIAGKFYVLGFFNYDNKSGLQWDSKVEWKLGLHSSMSDTLRWIRVNEDLFRINSKVGFKAFKNFYYTAELDFQTQFFNTYKSNSNIRTSGPFSPMRTSFSLGMDYKYKDKISLFVSPVSYKNVFVADTTCKKGVLPSDNIPNQIGIKGGDRMSHQLGALIRLDFTHDFTESIGMEIKFNFFGNYVGKIKGVEVGCELIGNFKINRFLSAKVELYPRYDSTVIPADGGKPKIQFWELISLGFAYKI